MCCTYQLSMHTSYNTYKTGGGFGPPEPTLNLPMGLKAKFDSEYTLSYSIGRLQLYTAVSTPLKQREFLVNRVQ